MPERTNRSLRGEAVFLDVTEDGGGSLLVVFREAYDAPRLLVTGCGGQVTAIKLDEYLSDDDGFKSESVGRVVIREDGSKDSIQIKDVAKDVVRVDYSGRFPKLLVGDDEQHCLYQGEHVH